MLAPVQRSVDYYVSRDHEAPPTPGLTMLAPSLFGTSQNLGASLRDVLPVPEGPHLGRCVTRAVPGRGRETAVLLTRGWTSWRVTTAPGHCPGDADSTTVFSTSP